MGMASPPVPTRCLSSAPTNNKYRTGCRSILATPQSVRVGGHLLARIAAAQHDDADALAVSVMLGEAVQLRQLRGCVLHGRTVATTGGRGRCGGRWCGCRRRCTWQGLRLWTRIQPKHGGDDAIERLWNRHRAGAAAITHRAMHVLTQADLKRRLALLHGSFQDHIAAVCMGALDLQSRAGREVGNRL